MSQQEHGQRKMTQSGFILSYAPGRGAIADTPGIARRLVACWNACEGIETGALELMTGPLSIENQIKYKPQPPTRKSKYREQRDVLLEMLLKCRDMVGHTDNIFMIDAAIAQVKGSTS